MTRILILLAVPLILFSRTPGQTRLQAATGAGPAGNLAKIPLDAQSQPTPKSQPNPVLAKVGKETIRQSDFNLFLDNLSEQDQMQIQLVPGLRAKYLSQFLDIKVLAAKARKEGLQHQPSHAKVLALLDSQLLSKFLLGRDGPALAAKSTLTEDQLKSYFTTHRDQFNTPPTLTVRHILVSTQDEDGKKGLPDEAAKAKAEQIRTEVQGGKSFEAAAKEYSDDLESKDKGGLYENVPFGKLLPEIDQAARSQEIGTVGQPVKTRLGYHLIEVEHITPPASQTFEDAKDAVKEQAVAERQRQVVQEYLEGARRETGFKLGPGLKEEPAPKAEPEDP
jgi:peptidyl-prolyl cis-trans isomerase C